MPVVMPRVSMVEAADGSGIIRPGSHLRDIDTGNIVGVALEVRSNVGNSVHLVDNNQCGLGGHTVGYNLPSIYTWEVLQQLTSPKRGESEDTE